MDERETYRSLMTIGGVLAGFSFAAVVGLLAINTRTRALGIAFVAFLLATFLFIASVLGGWVTLDWIIERANTEYTKKAFYTVTLFSFFGGLLAFVVGASATAFIHSSLAGFISIAAGEGLVAFFLAAGAAS